MSFTVALIHSKMGCADINCDCKTQNIRTSIFTAAQIGDITTIQRRIVNDKSGSLVKKTDGAGYTMLHLAAQGNHTKLVEYLLDQGADPNGGDSCGCAPLHRASFSGCMEAVRLLVLAGADINAIDNSFGDKRTPLHKAAGEKHMDVYRFLLASGSDPSIQDNRGLTPSQLLLLSNEHGENSSDKSNKSSHNAPINDDNYINNGYITCQVIKRDSEKAVDDGEVKDIQKDFEYKGKTCIECGKVAYMFAKVRGKLVCTDCKRIPLISPPFT